MTDHERQLEAAAWSGYTQAINDILRLRLLSKKAKAIIAQFSAGHGRRCLLEDERDALLRIGPYYRTQEQDTRLAEITYMLLDLPSLSMSRSDREAMSIIRDAAKRLRP